MFSVQIKTSYSILKSLNNIPSLVAKAASFHYKALAITDSNNMFGVMEFYLECKKHNIKPIIGIELDIQDKKILLYAKNNQGYKNLIKLTTIISNQSLTIDDLIKYKDSLILVIPSIYYDDTIYNIYEDRFIGYNTTSIDNKKDAIYINDVSYLNKLDYKYLDYVYMIDEDKKLGNYELETHKHKHLLDNNEYLMIDEEVRNNMKKLVDMCNVEIGYTKDLLPIYDPNIDAFTYLSNLCHKGLSRRLNNNVNKTYIKRLEYELNIINKMGFCNYFLIVWDYVKYAKFNNIMVGPGRGSAAGSLVSYTLGITDIDPIEHNLLFERFLNPERITMPDIDIDFDSEKRSQVIEYVISKYGEKKVCGIITFNTLGAKQVIRDVGRVMNISITAIDKLSKMVKDNLKDSYQNNSQFKTIIDNNYEFKKLYDIAIHLEGLPRHISVHAAGIIMSRIDLDETIPLYKNQLGMYVTGYSMDYLESLGLLKMDFLGISNLTLIDKVIHDIREKEKINITFSKIPLNDKRTLNIFKEVKTDGIFQFESPGMKRFLKKLQPQNFDDIVAAIALFRPGPMDNIDTYIRRKEGKEQIDYLDKNLEEILKPTYGIIIYQEQIMQIAQVLAGYSLAEADILRRAMSKKKEEILKEEASKFINNSIKRGYSKELSEKVYNLILKFAGYGFNKSHSVGYSVVAFKMAFLKTYFFKYFMNYLLTNSIGSEVKTKIYINECRSNNLKVIPPNINISTSSYEIIDNTIICPLSIVKGVGVVGCTEIINERNNAEFKDFIDFIDRSYKKGISRKVVENLIYSGAFSIFNYNKRTLIENLDDLYTYAEINKTASLFETVKPEIIIYEEYNKEELIELEFKMFGFYLTEHPVSKYRKEETNLLEIENNYDKTISLVLLINNIREVVTKKNDVMAFIQASDEFNTIDLTLFPNIYKQVNKIQVGNIIKVIGKVEKRFDKYQIVVNNLSILE